VFKSATRPLCRCCGKPIAMYTRLVWVNEAGSGRQEIANDFSRSITVDKRPTSREECQRLTNWKVTAVSYFDPRRRSISSFHEWDGESWKDEFFCTGTCAQEFGRLCAQHQTGPKPLCRVYTKAWHEAVQNRLAETEGETNVS